MSCVLDEWHTYYKYEEGVTEADGDIIIRAHVAKNYSSQLYKLRRRDARVIQSEPEITLHDHQPEHIPDAAWDVMCTYSDDDSFKNKSKKMKKNYNQLRIVHTTS